MKSKRSLDYFLQSFRSLPPAFPRRALIREFLSSVRGVFMRVLVAWDEPDQADLLSLFLGDEENEIKICLSGAEFAAENHPERWDVVLMSLTFPKTADEGFGYFQAQ